MTTSPLARRRTGRPTTPPGPAVRAPQLSRAVAWSLGSGTILQPLNSSVIAVALVPIAASFGSSSAIPWIVSGLYIATAVMSPTAGRLADVFGARRMYLIGLVVVTVAAVAGPFVPTAGWLVADRVLLGIGTAMHFPASMAIIRDLAARREQSPTNAIGVIALCGQTMAALGPTLGGLLVAVFGWHGVFLINVPVALVAIVLVLRTVPASVAPPRESGVRAALRLIDPVGAALLIGTLVTLMIGLLSLGDSPRWLLLGAALPLGSALVLWELRVAHPFVDVRAIARTPALAQVYGRTFLTFVAFYCVFYGLPQWLQTDGGYDTAATGLLVLPVFAAGVLGTLVATRLARRSRPRVLLVVGSAALAAGGTVLALTVREDGPVILVVLSALLLGIPTGFNNLGNQLDLHVHAAASGSGAAAGMYRTAQYVGACLSTVVVARAFDLPLEAGGIDALGVVVGGVGTLLLLTSVVALVRTRHRKARA
ncbi:MFS transporter [Serinibacter arcticus]|uniref:MFS transporter n=1 Tax=Serinibacter arcticus TaxID=1655435 RepID=UPI001C106A0A|nr:MFS transporter [Serinibacter arcticus]